VSGGSAACTGRYGPGRLRDRAGRGRKGRGRAAIGAERGGRRVRAGHSLWSERGAGRAVGGKGGAGAGVLGLDLRGASAEGNV